MFTYFDYVLATYATQFQLLVTFKFVQQRVWLPCTIFLLLKIEQPLGRGKMERDSKTFSDYAPMNTSI